MERLIGHWRMRKHTMLFGFQSASQILKHTLCFECASKFVRRRHCTSSHRCGFSRCVSFVPASIAIQQEERSENDFQSRFGWYTRVSTYSISMLFRHHPLLCSQFRYNQSPRWIFSMGLGHRRIYTIRLGFKSGVIEQNESYKFSDGKLLRVRSDKFQ